MDGVGGIQSVIRTLSENTIKSYTYHKIESTSNGNIIRKFRAYIIARSKLREIINSNKDQTVVHFHSASDFSFRRKIRLAQYAHSLGGKIIFHIHSGQIISWLSKGNRAERYKKILNQCQSTILCLSEKWKESIEPLLGPCNVVNNPFHPVHKYSSIENKNPNQLVLLARNNKVKGFEFAIELMNEMWKHDPDIHLHCSGMTKTPKSSKNLTAYGVISDTEKISLLQESSILLLPSKFEGQPVVALEALASGTYVIASDTIHSLPQTVVMESKQSVHLWINAILEIRNRRSEDRETLVSSVESHSIQNINKQLERVYLEKLS